MLPEHELIALIANVAGVGDDVVVGIGDDAAVLAGGLVVSSDRLFKSRETLGVSMASIFDTPLVVIVSAWFFEIL